MTLEYTRPHGPLTRTGMHDSVSVDRFIHSHRCRRHPQDTIRTGLEELFIVHICSTRSTQPDTTETIYYYLLLYSSQHTIMSMDAIHTSQATSLLGWAKAAYTSVTTRVGVHADFFLLKRKFERYGRPEDWSQETMDMFVVAMEKM